MHYIIPQNDELFVFREEEDGALIFFRKTEKIETLNKTGAAVFKLLYGQKKEINALLIDFKKQLVGEIPSDDILLKDIKEFLETIKKHGLLNECTEDEE